MKPDDLLRLRESWIAFFFLGIVMLNFPFLAIVNKDVQVLGIPLLVLYFLVGWPLSIMVIFFFSRSLEAAPPEQPESPDRDPNPPAPAA